MAGRSRTAAASKMIGGAAPPVKTIAPAAIQEIRPALAFASNAAIRCSRKAVAAAAPQKSLAQNSAAIAVRRNNAVHYIHAIFEGRFP